jgi:hypothetical protein
MNPWALPPDHPALAALRDDLVWPRINHPDLAAIYPPFALAGYALVSVASYTAAAAKLWVLVHDAALMLVLAAMLRGSERSEFWVAAYAWNPLTIVEYSGAGHHEPVAMLWLALALMLRRRHPSASALAFTASVLTRLLPLLALPFLWRHWTLRARTIALVLTGAGLGAYVALTRGADSGLGAYLDRWRNNELVFDLVARAGGPGLARICAVAVVLAAFTWAWRRHTVAEDGARVALRSALLTGPVLHPWYLGWDLMLQPFRVSWPWLLLSLTVVLSYGPLRTPAERGSYHAPLELRLVEYGIPLVAALVIALRSRKN